MERFTYGVTAALGRADKLLRRNNISSRDIVQADTACYRVETIERYAELMCELGATCRLLDESEVAGRLIAVFDSYGALPVPYLELPQPKPNNKYREGFEHVQFVV